jgi:hypothetical protein
VPIAATNAFAVPLPVTVPHLLLVRVVAPENCQVIAPMGTGMALAVLEVHNRYMDAENALVILLYGDVGKTT